MPSKMFERKHTKQGRVMSCSGNIFIFSGRLVSCSIVLQRTTAGLCILALVDATLKSSLHYLIPIIYLPKVPPAFCVWKSPDPDRIT